MIKTSLFTVIAIVLLACATKSGAMVFEKKKLQILTTSGVSHDFVVEIADDGPKHELGLSGRKSMQKNHGMLFLLDGNLFGKTRTIDMWMRNTYIPLDMVFIKSGGVISKISNAVPFSLETISSGGNVVAVLELNAGTCSRLGIKENDKVVLE